MTWLLRGANGYRAVTNDLGSPAPGVSSRGQQHLDNAAAGMVCGWLAATFYKAIPCASPMHMQGYAKLMQVLGSNVAEFLQNLNNLHLHLSMGWPSMMSPSFRCEQVMTQ